MNTELMTDDEALRVQGMADGPKKVSRITLRPVTVETWLWMETVNITDENIGRATQGAGFAFLHSEDEDTIRSVVYKKDSFWPEVSKWVGKNHKHHMELIEYWNEFDKSFSIYQSSLTTSANPSDPQPVGRKN